MNFDSLTAQEILDRISRHCPEAMSAYLHCINRGDDNGTVYFSRDMINIEMSEEYEDFEKNIKKLARENLLEWHPFDEGISVTLAWFDDE
jgi:hypothetical protein